MLLMFENGIRGGYSGVLGGRYVKANNKCAPLELCKAESKTLRCDVHGTCRADLNENEILKQHLLNEKNYQENPTRNNSYKLKTTTNYLLYLDANNLYGWAMSQKLPTGDFKWEAGTVYNWRNPPDERGCIVECDLEYSLSTKFKNSKISISS